MKADSVRLNFVGVVKRKYTNHLFPSASVSANIQVESIELLYVYMWIITFPSECSKTLVLVCQDPLHDHCGTVFPWEIRKELFFYVFILKGFQPHPPNNIHNPWTHKMQSTMNKWISPFKCWPLERTEVYYIFILSFSSLICLCSAKNEP